MVKAYQSIPRRGTSTEAGRKQFWQQVVTDQYASKLTIKEFCDQQGLPFGTFKAWKYRFQKEKKETEEIKKTKKAKETKQPTWIPLHIVAPSSTQASPRGIEMTIQFKNGLSLVIANIFSEDWLQKILSMLVTLPC